MTTNVEYETWTTIQDIVGPGSNWPPRIRRIFWNNRLNYFHRYLYVTFCYVNGLAPELAIHWLQIRRSLLDISAQNHVRSLFSMLESGVYNDNRRYNYYNFNVCNNRYEYINGIPK